MNEWTNKLRRSENKNNCFKRTDCVPSAGFPCRSGWRVLVQIPGSSHGRGQVPDGQRSSVSQLRHWCPRPGLCSRNRNARDRRADPHPGESVETDRISCNCDFYLISALVSLFGLFDFNLVSWLGLGSWSYPRLPWTEPRWMWPCGGVASLWHHRFANFAFLWLFFMCFLLSQLLLLCSSPQETLHWPGPTYFLKCCASFQMSNITDNQRYKTNMHWIKVTFKTNLKENRTSCSVVETFFLKKSICLCYGQ